MKIQTSIGTLRFRWEYGGVQNKTINLNRGKERVIEQDITTCDISSGKEVIATGKVGRFVSDEYNKHDARKYSFAAAIKNLKKEDRAIAWDEFRKSIKHH
jgi:hypothetical protein